MRKPGRNRLLASMALLGAALVLAAVLAGAGPRQLVAGRSDAQPETSSWTYSGPAAQVADDSGAQPETSSWT